MSMNVRVICLTLIVVSSSMAGCTGDPDAGGNDELDLGMLQDFLNNTTLDVESQYFINGTSGSTLHTVHGVGEGISVIDLGIWQDYDNQTESAFSIDIQQPEGYRIDILQVYFMVEFSGTCGNDCRGYSEFQNYSNWGLLTSESYSFHQGFTGGLTHGTNVSTTCPSVGMNGLAGDPLGMLFGPGLACEHTIGLSADYSVPPNVGLEDWREIYSFEWSDWTYYVHYAMTPVNLET